MPYGILKVDQVTFTNAGVDQTISVSGIVASISGNITATGTISGDVIRGGTLVSGATVTGTAGQFGTITGNTAGFTTVTGTTITGTTAQFTTVTGGTAGFTTLTGTTVTGTTANFVTVSGTTVSGNTGQFATVTGGTAGFTTVTGTTITGTTLSVASGTFTGNSTAAAFIPTGSTVPTNGVYLPAANSVAVATNGTGRLFVNSSGSVGIGTSSPGRNLTVQNSATIVAASLVSNPANIAYLLFGDTDSDAQGRVQYDNSSDSLQLYSSGSERVRIDSTGRVGIGTTSPGAPLDVVGSSNTVVLSSNATDATTKEAKIQCRHYTNSEENVMLLYGFSTSTANELYIGGGSSSQNALTSIVFSTSANNTTTSGTERARIDSSGRLLVGTSSARSNIYNTTYAPQIQLEGNDNANSALSIISCFNGTSIGGQLILGKANSGSVGVNGIVANGNPIGRLSFQGNDGSEFVEGACIEAQVDGTPGANDMPGRLVFSTTADGTSSPTERMRITSGGGFKVSNNGSYALNTTNTHEVNHNLNNSAVFHVYHTGTDPYGHYVKFTNANPNNTTSYVFSSLDNTGANIYTINSNGTVTARSDAKFKKNIETARNGYLEDLAQLRVVKYNWHNHDDDTPRELGFIAQEVEQVFPGLVSTVPDKDDQGNETGEASKSIKTSVFTPMLVKALQEALERIETLEAAVTALQQS